LIDSSYETQFERFEEAGLIPAAPRGGEIVIRNPAVVPTSLPADLQSLARSFTRRAGFVATLRSELGNLRLSADELRAASPIPDVPLIVISHRMRAEGVSVRREKLWLDMQQELATRTSRAELVIADTEDHYVQLSDPAVVVAAIRKVLDEIRSGTALATSTLQ
jgi:hypothetical protein